jgi:DNA-binding transcriptional MerR regulator
VAAIVRGQEAGLTLAELRDVLRAPDPARRRALLEHHKTRLEAKLADLLASKQMIDHALNCPEKDFTRCEHFRQAIRGVIERYSQGRIPAKSGAECLSGNRLVTRRSGRAGPKRSR